MRIGFDTDSMKSYRQFLALKRVPQYRWDGEYAEFPDEYAGYVMGVKLQPLTQGDYDPIPCAFDYQRDITKLALQKKKFAAFVDCGLGKTLILLEFARVVHQRIGGRVLLVGPLMVTRQTLAEAVRFYGPEFPIQFIPAAKLGDWMRSGTGIGLTNYEAISDDLPNGTLSGLLLDESSMLKSHYGTWAQRLIEIGKGVEYKLAATGTPAPNDRVEYANHAVFLDQCRSVNEFCARYFVNKGQTSERWIMRAHAVGAFFREMSHWAIFLQNPATYGWKDNCGTIPPIHVHIDHVELTREQRAAVSKVTGKLLAGDGTGSLGDRSKLAQIAKGFFNDQPIPTNKNEAIHRLVDSWRAVESTLIWCRYNNEQDAMESVFPNGASIRGDTDEDDRLTLIDSFKNRATTELISKPKILGFGLNLQVATRQLFSGLQDSYEEFYQCVKRSNRVGSTKPLNVHIPITEIEEPMIQNVLEKRHRVMADIEEQEALFKEHRIV